MKKRIFGVRVGTILSIAFGVVCAVLVWMFSKNEEAAAAFASSVIRPLRMI